MLAGTTSSGDLVVPRLNPADVKLFLAEDDALKRDVVLSSLGAFSLDHSVTVATNYKEAEEFIASQQPHALTANVFLFDGGLDPNDSRMLWHGSRLAAQLLASTFNPWKLLRTGLRKS